MMSEFPIKFSVRRTFLSSKLAHKLCLWKTSDLATGKSVQRKKMGGVIKSFDEEEIVVHFW
jgi:hypothetical protein